MMVSSLLRQAQDKLSDALRLPAAEARIEARVLLCRALDSVSHAWLIAHDTDVISAEQADAFDALLQRRMHGEPVAYILGEREFYGLNLKVTPATLIPRPDTELLVELALQHIPDTLSRPYGHPLPLAGEGLGERVNLRVLDMGTGSGAIALAIAHERPDASVLGVDASAAALTVAQENAQVLGLTNTHFMQSNWFSALVGQSFALIISNPPYIATGNVHLGQGDVRFEPASALASGPDGLDDIRHIVSHGRSHLQPRGWLLLEHGYDQAGRVRALLQQAGFDEVFSACDLAGIERVSGGRISS